MIPPPPKTKDDFACCMIVRDLHTNQLGIVYHILPASRDEPIGVVFLGGFHVFYDPHELEILAPFGAIAWKS